MVEELDFGRLRPENPTWQAGKRGMNPSLAEENGGMANQMTFQSNLEASDLQRLGGH
jgi:hypothetical protein